MAEDVAHSTASHDVVVIGSGPGGLVAAAYLAAAGRKVVLVEQHHLAGGNCTVFRHGDYEFDVGLHYLGDCGPGGLIPSLLGGVGLADRVEFVSLDSDGFDTLQFPDVELRVPADWDLYRDRLVETFPADGPGITHCLEVLAEVAHDMRSAQIPGVETPALDEWGLRPLAELFAHCELSPRARSALNHWSGLYGSGPADTATSMHAMIVDHYMRGAYYPAGGGQLVAARLVEVIEALGGEVRTLARVEEILVDEGTVAGVRLQSGEVLDAPVVVSNADYKRTIGELIDPKHLREETIEAAEEAVMTLGLVCAYVVVSRDLVTNQPNTNYFVFPTWDTEAAYAELEAGSAPDDTPVFSYIALASRKDPGNPHLCPPGFTNLQIMTLAPRGYGWWGVDQGPAHGATYRRNDRYREAKAELTEQLLDAAEQVLGPIRDDIVHLEMASPLTHERYTLSSEGTSYGLQHSPDQSGKHRPGYRTEIEGLYLAGANTVSGHGIAGAMVGGVNCAGRILQRPLLIEAMTGAVLVDPAALPVDGPDWDAVEVSRGATLREERAQGRRARAKAGSSPQT